ncbi:MAG: alginate export family protein, partial [Candidatus Omnitrophota bacterium]
SGTVPAGVAVPGTDHASSATSRSEADDYFMTITQLQVAADLTSNVSTVVNLVNQRDWNAGPDEWSPGPSAGKEFDIELDLAYVQLREIFYAPLTLTIGRQDLWFGRGLIVGWNNLANTDPNLSIQDENFSEFGAFDGVRATLDFKPWTLDFVYTKIDENAHDPEDDLDLYFVNVNYAFAEYNAVAEIYYARENDRATLAGTGADDGTRNNDTNTIGGRVQFDPIEQITLGAEVAHQFGTARSAVDSPDRDRDAWAVDLFGTYRWDYEWKPEVTLEYVFLSGEEDLSPGATSDYHAWVDNHRGSIFGWIHDAKEFYFATASPSDLFTAPNEQFISVLGVITPLEDLKLSANYYYFWTDADLHLVPTDPNSPVLDDEIGHEIDVEIAYQYTEDVTFTFYANWFIPGDQYASPENATASEYISRVKVTF